LGGVGWVGGWGGGVDACLIRTFQVNEQKKDVGDLGKPAQRGISKKRRGR